MPRSSREGDGPTDDTKNFVKVGITGNENILKTVQTDHGFKAETEETANECGIISRQSFLRAQGINKDRAAIADRLHKAINFLKSRRPQTASDEPTAAANRPSPIGADELPVTNRHKHAYQQRVEVKWAVALSKSQESSWPFSRPSIVTSAFSDPVLEVRSAFNSVIRDNAL